MMTPFSYSEIAFTLSIRIEQASVPIPSATHRATHGTKHPQHGADDQQDNANRLQNRNFEDVPQYQQNDAQTDHDASKPIKRSMSGTGIELGCGKWHSVTFGLTPA
jgi:hypothetical protein